MTPQKNAISWFEIPANDLQRVQNFYESILGITMTPLDLDNIKMRMFPIEDQTCVGGALCILYLRANDPCLYL